MTKCRTLDGMSLEEALINNQQRRNKAQQPTRVDRLIDNLDTHPHKREVLLLAKEQLLDLQNTTTINSPND